MPRTNTETNTDTTDATSTEIRFVVYTRTAPLHLPRYLPHNADTLAQKAEIREATRSPLEPVCARPLATLTVLPGLNVVDRVDWIAFDLDAAIRSVAALGRLDPERESIMGAQNWIDRTAQKSALVAWRSIESRPEVLALLDARIAALPTSMKHFSDVLILGGVRVTGVNDQVSP